MARIKDYTELKPVGNLIKCPVCGKTGELRHYPDEPVDMVIHRKELQGFFWNVTKSCTVKKVK